MSLDVTVAIVTYNRKELLKDCINSLLNQSIEIENIIIVDNASSDGTSKLIRDNYGGNNTIKYYKLNENTGGAGGFNFAFKKAYESGSSWVWVMDDDVEPEHNCLEVLLETAKNNNLMIVQPNRIQVKDGSEFPQPLEWNLNSFKGTERKNFKVPSEVKKDFYKIAGAPFEGPLIHRDVLEKVGFPKKEYFLLFDDTDYFYNAHLKGIDIFLVKNAILYRKIPVMQVNGKGKLELKQYYYYRNYVYFNKINNKRRFAVKYVYIILGFHKYILFDTLKEGFITQYKLGLKALFDGLLGRMGHLRN